MRVLTLLASLMLLAVSTKAQFVINNQTLCQRMTEQVYGMDSTLTSYLFMSRVVGLAFEGSSNTIPVVVGLFDVNSPVAQWFNRSRIYKSDQANFRTDNRAYQTMIIHIATYLGRIWGCSGAAFTPFLAGDNDMYQVHRNMGIGQHEMEYFATQFVDSLKSFGIENSDIATAGSTLLWFGRCATPIASVDPTLRTQICGQSSCNYTTNVAAADLPAACSLYASDVASSSSAIPSLSGSSLVPTAGASQSSSSVVLLASSSSVAGSSSASVTAPSQSSSIASSGVASGGVLSSSTRASQSSSALPTASTASLSSSPAGRSSSVSPSVSSSAVSGSATQSSSATLRLSSSTFQSLSSSMRTSSSSSTNSVVSSSARQVSSSSTPSISSIVVLPASSAAPAVSSSASVSSSAGSASRSSSAASSTVLPSSSASHQSSSATLPSATQSSASISSSAVPSQSVTPSSSAIPRSSSALPTISSGAASVSSSVIATSSRALSSTAASVSSSQTAQSAASISSSRSSSSSPSVSSSASLSSPISSSARPSSSSAASTVTSSLPVAPQASSSSGVSVSSQGSSSASQSVSSSIRSGSSTGQSSSAGVPINPTNVPSVTSSAFSTVASSSSPQFMTSSSSSTPFILTGTICSRYSIEKFGSDDVGQELNFLTFIMTVALLGSEPLEPGAPAVTGILHPNSPLLPWFNGSIVYRADNQRVDFTRSNTSNPDFRDLVAHLSIYYGKLFGCSGFDPVFTGDMYGVHARMGITQELFDYWNQQILDTMAALTFDPQDIENARVVFRSFGRCGRPIPAVHATALPQVCGASNCQLANATDTQACSLYDQVLFNSSSSTGLSKSSTGTLHSSSSTGAVSPDDTSFSGAASITSTWTVLLACLIGVLMAC